MYHVSLLEQDIIRKKRINNQANQALLVSKREFEAKNNKKYKIEAIINDIIYGHKAKNYLLGIYYLVL